MSALLPEAVEATTKQSHSRSTRDNAAATVMCRLVLCNQPWSLVYVFVVTLSRAIHQPLPTPVHLVLTEAEATADLDKGSEAQRTRPNVHGRHLRSFVKQHRLLVSCVSPSAAVVTYCVLVQSFGCTNVVAVGLSLLNFLFVTMAVVLLQMLRSVWWLRGELANNALRSDGLDRHAHCAANVKHNFTIMPTVCQIQDSQVTQPKGGYCGYAAIATAFRSLPEAKQLFLQYPRFVYVLSAEEVAAH